MTIMLPRKTASIPDQEIKDLETKDLENFDKPDSKNYLLEKLVLPNWKILISVKYNEQILGVIKLRSQQHDEYYHNFAQNTSSLQLIYGDRNYQKTFKLLDEFGKFIVENSIDIISMARDKTAEFSEVLAVFLGLGRVVKNHRLYNKIAEKYGITDLDQCSPRIEKKKCVFLTYKPTSNIPNPPLVEITLFLANCSYKAREKFTKINISS